MIRFFRNIRQRLASENKVIAYLLTMNGKVQPLAEIGGMLVSAMKDVPYGSNVIMLKQGESILFFTDGVTEAFNKAEEEFRETRLEKILDGKNSLCVNELVNYVFKNVQSFSDGVEQSDDIICLALKYLKG
jgi:sigma-B regulation protein RsbU (phosphoserine phosphatase)